MDKNIISIRFKIALFYAIAGIVITIGIFGMNYYQGRQLLQKTIGDEHSVIISKISHAVSKEILEEAEKIELASINNAWRDAVKKRNSAYDSLEKTTLEQYFKDMDARWLSEGRESIFIRDYLENESSLIMQEIVKSDKDISELFITDKLGGLVASSGKTSDFYQADEEWWQKAYNNGKGGGYVGDIDFDESSNEWTFVIALPMVDKGGEIIGVIKDVINVREIFNSLKQAKIGRTGKAILLNSEGVIIYEEGKIPLSARFFSSEKFRRITENLGEWNVVSNAEIVDYGTEKKNVFICMTKVQNRILEDNNITWWVLVHQDASEVFSPISAYLKQAIGISILFLVLLLVIGYMFGFIISTPIEKLTKAVKDAEKEKLNYKINIKTRDEIEQLADSFQGMFDRVKNREMLLIRAKEYTENIISSMTDTLIVIAPDRKIKEVNKAACDLLGYKQEEMIGKDISMILQEEEEEEEEEKIFKGDGLSKLISLGSIREEKVFYKTKSGEKIPLSFSGSVLYDASAGKDIIGIVCVARDMRQIFNLIDQLEKSKKELEAFTKDLEKVIEERTKDLTRSQKATISIMEDLQESYDKLRTAQQQLIQAGKMEAIGKMASSVAHEVKNPLGIVIQGINYFEDLVPQEQKQGREVLSMMKNNIRRADRIIHDLLDFSRAGTVDFKMENINAVIESAVSLVQHKLNLKDIAIISSLQKDIPAILIDRGKIEQVLINLLSNSIQAITASGKICVSSYLSKNNNEFDDSFRIGEECVVVTVKDTGVGIDEDARKHIFEPFFTTKDRTEGTGLGLPVSKSIMEIHGGAILVDSEKDKGATITLVFKIAGGSQNG